ncbi:MAG: hypothetical protein AAB685_01875 [Patescibacteria group bacterium]
MKKYYLYLTLFGVLLMGIVISSIFSTTNGVVLKDLEQKIENLERENKELTFKLNESGSLSKIVIRVADEGFIKPGNIIYLTKVDSLAKVE